MKDLALKGSKTLEQTEKGM